MLEQQIIISGVGGQGVLFITRLLAEAAIQKGHSVLTAETHGMAQRGGTVISHLKVGPFTSPMIRPAQADGLLALKADNFLQHGMYLKNSGWTVVNGSANAVIEIPGTAYRADADAVACKLGAPRSVNLVLLGAALGMKADSLFCSIEDIRTVLTGRFGNKKDLLKASHQALEKGFETQRH
jgi:indolepyruvate ferredoxin oxidoreductase, beta subunit